MEHKNKYPGHPGLDTPNRLDRSYLDEITSMLFDQIESLNHNTDRLDVLTSKLCSHPEFQPNGESLEPVSIVDRLRLAIDRLTEQNAKLQAALEVLDRCI